MFERADLLGHTEPEHYLWPACQWGRYDATNPMLKWDTAWRALRDAAGLPGLRFHDLRHTVITELAEMGVADHVLESISGHLSRRMLEHYSHIRIDAKRQALDALDAARRSTSHNGDGNGDGADQTEIPAVVEVGDDLTSQLRHSLLLQGSPPSGKLLIPFERRDVRVVEGARLESVCTGNRTKGSNPFLSAIPRPSVSSWRRERIQRRGLAASNPFQQRGPSPSARPSGLESLSAARPSPSARPGGVESLSAVEVDFAPGNLRAMDEHVTRGPVL